MPKVTYNKLNLHVLVPTAICLQLEDCLRLPTSPSDDARRCQFGVAEFHEP